jgi:hypothetical protein
MENLLKQDIFIYLINHIVFPIQLPEESVSDDESKEVYFLNIIKKVIENLNTKNEFLYGSPEFNQITNMFVEWEKLQGYSTKLEEKKFFDSINGLKKNQSLAIYLRAQNTCLTIKPISNDEAILSMFQVSLENETIMSTENDIEITYPTQSISTNNLDLIRSEDFSQLIADLTNLTFAESNATSFKAGQNHVEIRDVPNTKLISEWIFGYLVSNSNSDINLIPSKVTKKYRDNVIVSKLLPFRRSGCFYEKICFVW